MSSQLRIIDNPVWLISQGHCRLSGWLPVNSDEELRRAMTKHLSLHALVGSRSIVTYLSIVLLLFGAKCQFNEDVLQLLVAVIDDQLLKTVQLKNKNRNKYSACMQWATNGPNYSCWSSIQPFNSTRETRTLHHMLQGKGHFIPLFACKIHATFLNYCNSK